MDNESAELLVKGLIMAALIRNHDTALVPSKIVSGTRERELTDFADAAAIICNKLKLAVDQPQR